MDLENTLYIYNTEEGNFRKELRENTDDVTSTHQHKFSELGLCEPLLRGIYEAGFSYPSPIQKDAIPIILTGNHVLARAKNGTGKTGAYAIPALQMVDPDVKEVQVLVIVPSRELAKQVYDVFIALGKHCGIRTSLTIGGTSVRENKSELNGSCHVLVGTPGRVHHLTDGLLGRCRLFIIDEADVLLSNHFFEPLVEILHRTPACRQILLFSATFPMSIKSFSDEWMPSAKKVNTMECLTLKGVSPFYIYIQEKDKLMCLWYLLRKLTVNQSIIFVNSVSRAELLYARMTRKQYSCVCIHSQMDQFQRDQIFEDFKRGKYRHLVSTNLFTRGIDVKTVNVVVNFDFPTKVDTYLHRIGRSGRYGQVGLSIEFVTETDKKYFYNTEDYLDIDIPQMPEEIDLSLYN